MLYGTKKLFPEAAPFPEQGDMEDVLKWIGELDEESLATPDTLRLQASVHRLRDARLLAAARAGLLTVQGTQVRVCVGVCVRELCCACVCVDV